MTPATIYAIGQGVSAVVSILGGIGAKKEAELNVFNMETEKVLNKARAMEIAQARREEYDMATASNIAVQTKFNDITSRSVQAFLEKQSETMGKDQKAIAKNTFRENLKITLQAAAERRRGRTALASSLLNAATTATEGYVGYQRVKKDLS
jgi:hypothetical protein